VLGILIISIIAGAFLIMVINPKTGMLFLWPMLFLYPHLYMWEKQLLPLNIGIDDLFICVMFLIVFVRRNLMGGVPIRLGYAFWGTFTFFLILLLSNMNSYLIVPAAADEFIKAVLKGVITILLAYSFTNSIDDVDDLKRLVFIYCFSAGLGAILMVFQQFFPEPLAIFTTPSHKYSVEYGGSRVPVGAFMNGNNAAIILGTASLMIVCTIQLASKYFGKWLRFTMVGIMVIAILFTKSRSGFLCLAIPLVMMGLMGKNRGPAILFIIIGIIIFLALPTFRNALFERFGAGGATGENVGFWGPILLRLRSISEMWGAISLRRLLFGESTIVDVMFDRLFPHNAYFGTTLTYGIGGTIWTVVIIVMMFRKSKVMKAHFIPEISMVGLAIRGCLVVFALYCIVGNLLDSHYTRYTLFLLMVLAQRGADLAMEYQPLDKEDISIYETMD